MPQETYSFHEPYAKCFETIFCEYSVGGDAIRKGIVDTLSIVAKNPDSLEIVTDYIRRIKVRGMMKHCYRNDKDKAQECAQKAILQMLEDTQKYLEWVGYSASKIIAGGDGKDSSNPQQNVYDQILFWERNDSIQDNAIYSNVEDSLIDLLYLLAKENNASGMNFVSYLMRHIIKDDAENAFDEAIGKVTGDMVGFALEHLDDDSKEVPEEATTIYNEVKLLLKGKKIFSEGLKEC